MHQSVTNTKNKAQAAQLHEKHRRQRCQTLTLYDRYASRSSATAEYCTDIRTWILQNVSIWHIKYVTTELSERDPSTTMNLILPSILLGSIKYTQRQATNTWEQSAGVSHMSKVF